MEAYTMNQNSFIICLLEDEFSEEKAEMVADDFAEYWLDTLKEN